MGTDNVLMPDGTDFEFWDDRTRYTAAYHVAQGHPGADDANSGTEDRPFATVSRAAELLGPKQKVVVHEGVYRECIRPARGGTAADAMVWYQAAPGERVVVKGSERWQPAWQPSREWHRAAGAAGRIWTAQLPTQWFAGTNPFAARNVGGGYFVFNCSPAAWRPEEIGRILLRCGAVFVDGEPLAQVSSFRELDGRAGAFWVEHPGLQLHLRLSDDGDPGERSVEVTTREQLFVPRERGLGYIRLSGFTFEHAADPVPAPWRAMVSAWRGHHWIIEDCTLRHANAVGMDVGNEDFAATPRPDKERWVRHIIRRNRISDCGICGIAAIDVNWGTLVEDNVIEHIGSLDLERVWESGGLKFHRCNGVLIRRNLFRCMRSAPGIWLDFLNRNTRVTGNVIADVQGILGGIYVEATHEATWVDRNVVWDVRGDFVPPDRDYAGPGINVDSGEHCVVERNLVGRVRDSYAVLAHHTQHARGVAGRTGLCRRHAVLNNLIVSCPRRVLFGLAADNRCEGNVYDAQGDSCSFCIQHPSPMTLQNLTGWREYFGFDLHGTQVAAEAELDAQAGVVSLRVDGELPPEPAGPFDAATWAALAAGGTVRWRALA